MGFAAGHNFLAKKADAENLLISNPDIVFIENNSVARLLKRLTSEIKVVGPGLINRDHKPQPYDHGEKPAGLKFFYISGSWQKRTEPLSVMWVSGAVFLIDNQIFDQVGGFDENFFLYGEELDLCIAVAKLGAKILYDPTIKVLHSVASSQKQRIAHIRRALDYFIDKHYKNNWFYLFLKLGNKIIPYS